MVILSKALRMQSQLRQLRHERDIYLSNAPELALLLPVAMPVMMSGIASRCLTLDAERIRTSRRVFGDLPDPASIPLRLEHDEHTNVGTITELSYDDLGNLLITCRVTDARAAVRPGFSIASIIDAYELDPTTCSATVRACRLQEISLVRMPMDSGALVQRRYAPAPHVEFYNTAISVVEKLQQLIQLKMKEQAA
jgi:hypothetical protein